MSIHSTNQTNLLILSTPHLSSLGDQYTPQLLDSVIEILLEFCPGIICTENLPGDVIKAMQSKGDIEALERFVGSWLRIGTKAQKLLKVKRAVAEKTVQKLLKQKRFSVEKRLELERSVARAKADYAKGHFVKESAKIHFKRLGI